MRTLTWKLDKADGDAFQVLSEVRCGELIEENGTEVEEANEKLVTPIIQTAEETIPKSAGGKRNKNVPWLDDCSKAIKRRNRDTSVHYKRAPVTVWKMIRLAKCTYWRQYCNKTGRETQLSHVWGMTRKMNGIKSNFKIPVLHNNNINAISNVEKAEFIAKTFVKIHSS